MPRDPRTYITVHDGMPFHRKVAGLSDGAFRAMVTAWCWCSAFKTDGRIPAAVWRTWAPSRVRQELLASGLFETDDDDVLVHDYLEHQRSAAEIHQLSEKRAGAGAKGGRARAERRQALAQANASSKPQANAQALARGVATDLLQANLKQSRADTDTEQITGRKNTSSEERERTRKRAAALPDGWEPELADRAWQKDKGIPASYAADELEKFRDHWRAKGELRADWSATWRNWLRRALEYNPPPAQQRPSDWKFG